MLHIAFPILLALHLLPLHKNGNQRAPSLSEWLEKLIHLFTFVLLAASFSREVFFFAAPQICLPLYAVHTLQLIAFSHSGD